MGNSPRHAVRAVAIAVIAVAATSCGGNAPPYGGTGPAGALSIPGDSLHKLATNAALWPVRQSAERDCEGSLLCWVPFGRKVEVNIYADTGARNVAANPVASGATLVGRFENLGRSSERRYNLTNGPYDFLLFAFRDPASGVGRWVIERVGKAPTGGNYQHATVAEGRYKGCGHPTTTYNTSFGEFRTCEMGPPPPPPGVTRAGAHAPTGVQQAGFAVFALVRAMSMLISESGDPAWFTCKAGCCVADPM